MILEPRSWERSVYSSGWCLAESTIPVTEPATGDVLAHVGLATPAHLDRAVGRAREAQISWAALGYQDRARVLNRAAQLFVEHAEEIGEWSSRETGATRPGASRQGEIGAGECREAAALAGAPYGELLRSAQPRLSFSRQVPVGIVGVIAPFNSPILLALRSVAPALALGNAVILKPDPRTPVVGGVLFARIFEEAGLPDGLLHVLPAGADVGDALVRHPDIPVIAFTGSTRAGQAIAVAAAEQLKRLHLELGGNSAMIVLDDADLERAAFAGARGSFTHQGQICMATGRHVVHESVAAQYIELLAGAGSSLPIGNPIEAGTLIGPLIDERQRDRVHELVSASAASGAKVVTGGTYDGLYYSPTVLSEVTPATPAYAEEVFGPVAPVITFSSLEEAAALARDSAYGLALGIVTRDVMKGLALADQIPTGLVHINDQTINDEAVVPFGGVGLSGNGARHGGQRANLEAFTETQWVTVRAEPPA